MIIYYVIAMSLITIISIYIYKKYYAISKNRGVSMPENCSETKKEKKKKEDTFPIEITDSSGAKYTYTSPSSATSTFTRISDKYVQNQFGPLLEEQLIDDFITKEDLDLYVNLGYLIKSFVSPLTDSYILTDRGRNALKWNQEFKKKWLKE